MLNVTTLLGSPSATDDLRYGHRSPLRSGAERRPVVVWNCTRRCNLACRHCYSDSTSRRYDELGTDEAMAFVADIADFGSPALLLSGGEPFMRPDLMEVVQEARGRGLAVTLSTNGTLIDAARARRVADAGVRYVGISIDGSEEEHDRFRGRPRAYARALSGIRALKEAGVRVGLRVTLTATAIRQLGDIFALVERERIDRACFYHLVPAGRGVRHESVAPAEARGAVERVFDWAEDLVSRGAGTEVLTVDNYADGPALVLRQEPRDPGSAGRIRERLAWNGGARNASGRGFAAVDWVGRVKPDQFWGGPALGSLRERPLSAIWTDPPDMLRRLRERSERLTGRCASCRFLDLCGGGLASRAMASGAGLEGSDPGCHLTDAEVASAA
ncbi:MAG: radical SAM protein [Thermoleophilia bacterium]